LAPGAQARDGEVRQIGLETVVLADEPPQALGLVQ
jgi:hypothetical protein